MSVETILVVDHSPTEHEFVASTLAARGYRVITASDGDEAVEKAAQEHPQLVVVNGIDPSANAHQVCRRLKAQPDARSYRVLMLTGRPQVYEPFWGHKRGADAYLLAPIVREELPSG